MTITITTVGGRRGRFFKDLMRGISIDGDEPPSHTMQVIDTQKTKLRLAQPEVIDKGEPVLREPKPPVFVKDGPVKKEPEPQKEITPYKQDEVSLVSYLDADHEKGPLYFHVWADDQSLAITRENIELRNTEDYMVMIMRFPYSAKGSYFPTATSFIDAGFSDMELIEDYDRLVELDLD